MANTNGDGQTPVRQAGSLKNILILLMKKSKCEITETNFSENLENNPLLFLVP